MYLVRFEPAASEVKGKCANHLATVAPDIKLFGNKMHMHIVLHVNILPNITRLEIRFCTLHLKNIVRDRRNIVTNVSYFDGDLWKAIPAKRVSSSQKGIELQK
jgi:hypothetical protein